MRFYADVTENRIGLDILAELDGLAAQLNVPHRSGTPSQTLGIARNGLILSGMLEQAIADDPAGNLRAGRAAQSTLAHAEALSDWWADRLLGRNVVGIPVPRPSCAASAVPMRVVVPEGYLFYALFPEPYAQVGRLLAAESTLTSYVVIGVRSIGTSLSAAMAAGLRSAGASVRRYTVRPIGDPFAREVAVAQDVSGAWRGAADRGATFIVVDEGPGLSGSSLASVVTALRSFSVPQDRIIIVCTDPPDSLPQAGPKVKRIWETTAFRPVRPAIERMLSHRLPDLLSDECNTTLSLDRDVSWGQWREHVAPILPRFERRKLLLRDTSSRRVLAKFVGFGAWGARKASLCRRNAERGFTPEYRGYAHGFVLQDWVGEALPVELNATSKSELLDTAAAYYAALRRDAGEATETFDLIGAATEVERIRDAWFGAGRLDDIDFMIRTASAGTPRAFDGDQRPEPVEWRRWGNRILKCDTADHFLDHSWARRQDIAFDLAGFMDEWQLSTSERFRFLSTYVAESGDHDALKRLPLFRCVYHAHRLAMYDTAYHAGMGDDELSLGRRRQLVGERLAGALAAPTAASCD